MQQWEANDIDQAFKEAAEKANFSYKSEGWKLMNARIQFAQNIDVFIKIIAVGAVVLVIGVVGYFTINTENPSERNLQFAEASDYDTPTALYNRENEPEYGNTLSEESGIIGNETELNQSNFSNSATEPIVISEEVSQGLEDQTNGHESNNFGIDNNFGETQNQSVIMRSQNTLFPIKPIGENNYVNEETARDESFSPITFKHAELPTESVSSLPNTISFHNIQVRNEEDIEPSERRTLSKVSLGVSLAPDYSGVSFKGNQAGYSMGISVSYHLLDRFSINSGVYYSNKGYRTNKGYKPYEGIWKEIQKPEIINAESQIIEIPLNIRLDFLTLGKNNIFIGSGLSTYFMLNEDYWFIYDGEGTHAIPWMGARRQNKHFFGIYNFSVGIQRRLSEHLAIEIEPYIKLPISGIGVGQVNLTSSGTFITARYFFR